MRLKFFITIFATSILFSDDNQPMDAALLTEQTADAALTEQTTDTALTESGEMSPTADAEMLAPVAASRAPSQTSSRCPPCLPPCEYSYRVQIGGNYTYAWITPKGSNTTHGSLYGTRTLVEYRPPDAIYGAVAFNWRMGTTKNSVTERKLQDYNVQERLGYTFTRYHAKARLSLFTGVGTSYRTEYVSVGTPSVEFDYTEFYVPVGFLFEHQPVSCFSWGVNFQWMPHVFPTVRIQPLSGAFWSLTYKLDNVYAELPLKFAIRNDRFAVIVAPFVEVWRDGHTTATTNTGTTLDLPSNKYLFTGVNVNLAFSF